MIKQVGKYTDLKQKGIHLINEFLGTDRQATLCWNDIWFVIDKIESLGFEVNYYSDNGRYSFAIDKGTKTYGSYLHKNRLEAIYMTILFFINSYNAEFHLDRRWR